MWTYQVWISRDILSWVLPTRSNPNQSRARCTMFTSPNRASPVSVLVSHATPTAGILKRLWARSDERMSSMSILHLCGHSLSKVWRRIYIQVWTASLKKQKTRTDHNWMEGQTQFQQLWQEKRLMDHERIIITMTVILITIIMIVMMIWHKI